MIHVEKFQKKKFLTRKITPLATWSHRGILLITWDNRLLKIGKQVCQGCMLSPCLFNLCVEYNMWNAGLDESQAGIKIARRNINNLRYADDATLMAENEEDFIFLGSKITVDGDCSHEIKRCLLLGSKAMTNIYSILKSRDITLPTKVHIVKTMVLPVVIYGCESCTTKKAEHQRTGAFKLWC